MSIDGTPFYLGYFQALFWFMSVFATLIGVDLIKIDGLLLAQYILGNFQYGSFHILQGQGHNCWRAKIQTHF